MNLFTFLHASFMCQNHVSGVLNVDHVKSFNKLIALCHRL